MKWLTILGLITTQEIPSPIADWEDDATKNGPTVRVQIPTAIQAKGRQFNKLEMAKRIAAARQANKELVKAEGRQLSWESKLIPEGSRNAPIPESNQGVSFENQEQMQDSLPDVKRYVHLDLSAAPVSKSYLIEIFTLFAKNSIGGVILEYGARFPYNSGLSSLRADVKVDGDNISQSKAFSFTIDDINSINDAAASAGLDIIPMLDVCTNAGFVLSKMPKLRIEPSAILDFNPFSIEVRVTLEKMIKQVLETHPKAGNIHLGCSKFGSLQSSKAFAKAMKEQKTTLHNAFLDHVAEVGEYIKKDFSSVRPLIWDETVNKIESEAILSHKFADFLDIVINTVQDVTKLDGRKLLKLIQRHGKVFESVWLATPFKCDVPNEQLPDVKQYTKHASELIIAAQSAPVYANLGGIILSGPSQRNFFSAICSLLPLSLPSLFATHLTTMRGSSGSSVLWEASRRLGFQARMPVVYSPRPQEVVAGDYPGSEIWRLVQMIENSKASIETLINGPGYTSYVNPYLIKTQRVSFFRLETIHSKLSSLQNEFETTKSQLLDEMKKIFDPITIEEWSFENLRSTDSLLRQTVAEVDGLMQKMKK